MPAPPAWTRPAAFPKYRRRRTYVSDILAGSCHRSASRNTADDGRSDLTLRCNKPLQWDKPLDLCEIAEPPMWPGSSHESSPDILGSKEAWRSCLYGAAGLDACVRS